MNHQTLISVPELLELMQGGEPPVLVDCRFDLRDPGAGERAWRAGHIPGAVYAHLDRDLSDLSRKGRGRHPLPDATSFCATLARWGATPERQVVAYDTSDGSVAARLWWLLRLLGHRKAAVLDGGLSAWVQHGGGLDAAVPRPAPGRYAGRFDIRAIAGIAVVAARMASGNAKLLDARAPERFRGEVEPIDRVAGHIPGAINRPYAANLTPEGRFKSAERLQQEYLSLLDGTPPEETVLMCGSGVTACHNLLAMEHAGLHGARVYAGSWSEWIEEPSRPVARGDR